MPSIKVVLYKSKTFLDKTHPIMLRVTWNRKPKYYSLKYRCLPSEWIEESSNFNTSSKGITKRQKSAIESKNRAINALKEHAQKILDAFKRDQREFTFQVFEERFLGIKEKKLVLDFFQERIDELHAQDKIGNKDKYIATRNILKKFVGSKRIYFPDIDYNFLLKFELFLSERGNTGGGISIHLRTLRAIINEGIRRGYMNKSLYPFSTQFNKNGYSLSKFKSNAKPRALSEKDMEAIKAFPVSEYPHLKQAVYYFLFIYYARGINFLDIAKLKWSNIYNGRLDYIRTKTGADLSIKLSDKLQEIIDFHRGTHPHYIFPILTEFHQSEQQIKDRVKKCLKKINTDLKEVGKILEINIPLTSYVARHTYATTLKRKGIDIAIISEGLGHTDVATTKAYLAKFGDDEVDKADLVL